MASDVESPEGVGAVIIADIKAIVAERLREEYLHRFIRLRNVLLLSDRPDDSKTMRLLSQPYVRDLEKKWDTTLQTLRSELPKTLDQLFGNLQPEFQEATGFPTSAAVNRARPITVAPNTTAVKEAKKSSILNKAETSAFDWADKPPNKRALDSEDPTITSTSKKPKKTPQTRGSSAFQTPIRKSMDIQDVKKGECTFSYGNYSGIYVLRCSLVRCKKRLKQDGPVIFTSHPFRDGLALDHFNNEGHNIDSEAEIFRKYAIKVLGTSAERKTEKRRDSVFDSSCSEVDLSSLPASPKKFKDKGKKPERPYNLYSPRKPEASTSGSASKATETFRESFYRAGPLSSVPDSTLPPKVNVELPPRVGRSEQGTS